MNPPIEALTKKRKWTLLPWKALSICADVMTGHGADTHPPDYWRTLSVRDHLDAALRHLTSHLSGETVDPGSHLPHLAHASLRTLMALGVSGGESVPILCSVSTCRQKAFALDRIWRCEEHHAARNQPPPLPASVQASARTSCPHCTMSFLQYSPEGVKTHQALCPMM